MPNIAIVDDNLDQSKTLAVYLQANFEKYKSTFNVITQFPFQDPESYFDFILNNDICLLILDERLNDQSTANEGPVSYKGNELIVVLRKRLKDFPIFMITTYDSDPEVLEKQGEFENIISRHSIYDENEASLYIPRIIRAAARYLDSNVNELNEFSKLTRGSASGSLNDQEKKRLEALKIKLELPLSDFNERETWLKEYEEMIKELKKLKETIEAKIASL